MVLTVGVSEIAVVVNALVPETLNVAVALRPSAVAVITPEPVTDVAVTTIPDAMAEAVLLLLSAGVVHARVVLSLRVVVHTSVAEPLATNERLDGVRLMDTAVGAVTENAAWVVRPSAFAVIVPEPATVVAVATKPETVAEAVLLLLSTGLLHARVVLSLRVVVHTSVAEACVAIETTLGAITTATGVVVEAVTVNVAEDVRPSAVAVIVPVPAVEVAVTERPDTAAEAVLLLLSTGIRQARVVLSLRVVVQVIVVKPPVVKETTLGVSAIETVVAVGGGVMSVPVNESVAPIVPPVTSLTTVERGAT